MSNLLPNEKWTTCPLSYLCDADGSIQTGPFGTQLHASDYVPSGVPCIMPQDIIDGRISTEKIAYISEENANRLSTFRLLQNDIIYPRRGDIAKHALITSKENGWLCGTGCLRIRLNTSSILPQYLYYYLTLPHVRDWIAQNSVGATMPHLNTSLVGQISVSYPTYDEQQVIINILGSLDDKIDLNRRTNETLEAMARALFRDWFVDFGPTRAKMAGEASYLAPELWELFPDRLDDEGKPEGWEITTLGNLATNCGESIYPEQVDPLTPYVGLEHLPRRSISLSTWDRAEKITSGKSVFHEGNILFGKLRPYFHKVVIAPVNGICSTDIVVIDAKKDIWRSIVRLVCSSKDFVDFTDRTSQGTKMPRTSWGTMKAYELIQAPDNICFAFENITNTFFVKIQKNIMQYRNLAQLRDLLLPKLMSGEISIRDAEKMVEDAA